MKLSPPSEEKEPDDQPREEASDGQGGISGVDHQ